MARVLLIDPDRIRAIYVRRLLARGFHEVLRCDRSRSGSGGGSVEGCLRRAVEECDPAGPHPADLVVVAEDGPAGRALIAHRTLRLEIGPEIPILIHAERSPALLPDDPLLVYLERPIRLEALLATVGSLLRRRKRVEEEMCEFLATDPGART